MLSRSEGICSLGVEKKKVTSGLLIACLFLFTGLPPTRQAFLLERLCRFHTIL